jgi:plastocyanin
LTVASLPRALRSAALLIGIALSALVFAACSGSSTGGAGSSPVATSTVDQPPSYKFVPAAITVPVGTTVTWTNNDAVAHTVTASDGSFDSGNLAPGDSWSHTFTAAGSFDYRCNYHPDMLAKVIVN